MSAYTLDLNRIDKTMIGLVGGKGANLGELTKIKDIYVPRGFCITTNAFNEIIASSDEINSLIDQLDAANKKSTNNVGANIRMAIEEIPIPKHIIDEIIQHIDTDIAYAIRSSATAEDLPSASFAGQQDTYLNVKGKESILKHISKCWASLFTDRAIAYRAQNNFDHRKVQLSVVVQEMVFPRASGILFTADPVTSNRKVLSIDASFGLGEALVSGIVNADVYKVRDREILEKKISNKKIAIYASNDGGTKEYEVEPGKQDRQAITDEQILRLEKIGRKIEAHFGSPQDVEWCLVDDILLVVQSRPITTLFPIPEANDKENHVYVSVGHQQMMTDAMKPLGLSFYLLITPAPMRSAAGRLFVDVAPMLSSPAGESLLDTLGKYDPLIKDALTTVIERGDFIKVVPGTAPGKSVHDYNAISKNDPSIISKLIQDSENEVEYLKQNIQSKSGPGLFDFILDDLQKLKKSLTDPQNFAAIMTGMNASHWINDKMLEWLGEKNVADTVSQSVANNVTSEMGLDLLDVADVIRKYPEVIDYLQQTNNEFLDELPKLKGGEEARSAIKTYLDKYGMRCVGEIDITRTRWSEKPSMLIPWILSNIRNFEPGESKRKFEQGLQQSLQKEREILDRLKELPDGEQKAEETKQMIALARNFLGYREYPKYSKVSRYLIYKKALLREAEEFVKAGVIHEKEDIYYLSFKELHEVVQTRQLDYNIITQRKDDYKSYEKLNPPRVITSDGEILSGHYNRDVPAGAIVGLAVSSGIIEGRARVILNMEEADLEDGDILVTAFTDPSWTPLFVSIKGLVTQVGGLMTHGAVIAREYGIPAVVGVDNATKVIRDGQRIRVNGTDGYVEILS